MIGRFAVAVALALAGPAAAAAPAGLGVVVTDGVEQTHSGEALSYDLSFTNDSAASVSALVTVTIPEFASYSNTADALVSGQEASWNVIVEPGAAFDATVSATVGDIPEGTLRVTTLVSVYLPEDAADPLIRTADSNLIEGVIDPAHTVESGDEAPVASALSPWILVAGAALVLILAAAALLLLWRARQRSAASA